jgi:hypothetical protein
LRICRAACGQKYAKDHTNSKQLPLLNEKPRVLRRSCDLTARG